MLRAQAVAPGGRRGAIVDGVTARRTSGSWITGVLVPGHAGEYPGEDLGLPKTGPRSAAGIGRRVLALLIDWLLCEVVAVGAFGSQFLTIAVFAAEVWLLTSLTGFSVGKRIVGIRVARIDGRPVGFVWSLVRTLLLLCVVPPLVYDGDMRGLHDKAANTIVIRV